ncbi:MAG TPA: ester cyclase [Chloroflexia bacterium]|nr:ester cyclase [Chloroflexia bacterium]
MNPEELKALVRLFYEDIWNKGNVAALDVFLEPDFVFHNPVFPVGNNGIEGYRRIVNTMHLGFPDQHWVLEDVLVDNDKVVTRWKMYGTHTGPYLGIAPTGKEVTISGMSIERFVGSKIAEQWVISDALGFLLQEGFTPSRPVPEPAGF